MKITALIALSIFSRLTTCAEKEIVDGDRVLSTPSDFSGGGPEMLANSFAYSFSRGRIRSTNVAAPRKESVCYTSFGIFSWD
jgi:hypothetical protein